MASLLSVQISAVCNQLRDPLTASQLDLLDFYAGRLLEENLRANLTGARDRHAIYRRHFAESIALLAALEKAGIALSPVIDVGTGAGLPGIPMKIARPDLDLTLLEATGKKTDFLHSMVSELSLEGTRIIKGRAEEVAHEPGLRGRFALVVARTVAPLPVLLELTLPFLQIGGHLAAPKGSGATREIGESANALRELGGEIVSAETLDLPFDGPKPVLVLVKKSSATPERYPRRAGIPNKRPL